jgi:hypothetical protein
MHGDAAPALAQRAIDMGEAHRLGVAEKRVESGNIGNPWRPEQQAVGFDLHG